MKKEKKGISYQFKLIEMKMVKARIPLEDMRALVFPIIPYQVITGNYDAWLLLPTLQLIIPYQVITGNYDVMDAGSDGWHIIPYQVITGNYDR